MNIVNFIGSINRDGLSTGFRALVDLNRRLGAVYDAINEDLNKGTSIESDTKTKINAFLTSESNLHSINNTFWNYDSNTNIITQYFAIPTGVMLNYNIVQYSVPINISSVVTIFNSIKNNTTYDTNTIYDNVTSIKNVGDVISERIIKLEKKIGNDSEALTNTGTNNSQIIVGATINALENTITNISNINVATNAAIAGSKLASGIDATKIADGSVSNTQFQYLSGATSNIQTQLNNIVYSVSNVRNWLFDATNATSISSANVNISFSRFVFNGTNNGDNITINSKAIICGKSPSGTATITIQVSPSFTMTMTAQISGSGTYVATTTSAPIGTLSTVATVGEILVKSNTTNAKFTIAQIILQ
jgi:hypothetical protein